MLFNTPHFRVLNANTSSAPISIYTGKFLIQNREYGFKLEINIDCQHFELCLNQIYQTTTKYNNILAKHHRTVFFIQCYDRHVPIDISIWSINQCKPKIEGLKETWHFFYDRGPLQLANAKSVYTTSNAQLYLCPRVTDKGFQRGSMISLEHACHWQKIV